MVLKPLFSIQRSLLTAGIVLFISDTTLTDIGIRNDHIKEDNPIRHLVWETSMHILFYKNKSSAHFTFLNL